MKSIQHVLWRGALALSLMAVGIGSGIGMPPAERAGTATDCPLPPSASLVAQVQDHDNASGTTVVVLRRRPVTPAG